MVVMASVSLFILLLLVPLAAITSFSVRVRNAAFRAAGLEAGIRGLGEDPTASTILFVSYFSSCTVSMQIGPVEVSFSLLARIVYVLFGAAVSVYAYSRNQGAVILSPELQA